MNIQIQKLEIKIHIHYHIWIFISNFCVWIFIIKKIALMVSLSYPTHYSFKGFVLGYDSKNLIGFFKFEFVFFHYGKLIKLIGK